VSQWCARRLPSSINTASTNDTTNTSTLADFGLFTTWTQHSSFPPSDWQSAPIRPRNRTARYRTRLGYWFARHPRTPSTIAADALVDYLDELDDTACRPLSVCSPRSGRACVILRRTHRRAHRVQHPHPNTPHRPANQRAQTHAAARSHGGACRSTTPRIACGRPQGSEHVPTTLNLTN